MNRSDPTPPTAPAVALAETPALVVVLLAGFLLAVFGTYWDDAWHTEEGRDGFLIAPHVTLYAGISLAGVALTGWAAIAARAVGLREAAQRPGLLLALVGVAGTLLAAPIDNGWHLAFGRDAVIWSPPHMLGIAGTLAIGAAVLLELSGSGRRWAAVAQTAAAGAVLAAAAMPVLEYETDVPQFDVVFYLPVLALGAAFALSLVQRALVGSWPAARAAVAYMLTVAVIAVVMLAASMPAPLLPLLVVPAMVLDWARARGLSRTLTATWFAGSLYAVYVPYLDLLKNDVFVDFEAVLIGLPLAIAGCWLSIAFVEGRAPRSLPPSTAVAAGYAMAVLVVSALATATPALGHDPGQGPVAGTARWSASSIGDAARLEVELPDAAGCDDVRPVRVVARRAGVELTGQLERVGNCRYRGAVQLEDRGRWFLYAEFERGSEMLETWLPIHAGDPEEVVDSRVLYVPPQDEASWLKLPVGLLLYAGVAGLLMATGRIYRSRPAPAAS